MHLEVPCFILAQCVLVWKEVSPEVTSVSGPGTCLVWWPCSGAPSRSAGGPRAPFMWAAGQLLAFVLCNALVQMLFLVTVYTAPCPDQRLPPLLLHL